MTVVTCRRQIEASAESDDGEVSENPPLHDSGANPSRGVSGGRSETGIRLSRASGFARRCSRVARLDNRPHSSVNALSRLS